MTKYETDTRVPLIVRSPGATETGNSCDRLVEFVDVYPTLCELAELPVPDGLEGHGFAPLLENRKQSWKSAVFSQFLRDGIWVAPDGVEYMGYSVRTERYRYVEWRRWGDDQPIAGEPAARELYDHQTDPGEDVNIVDRPENRALAADLARQLRSGWRQALPR